MASNSDKIVRSKRSCCVSTCAHSEAKNPYLEFYRFPGRKWETNRKQQWIEAIKRVPNKNKLWSPTPNSRVCSAHFVGGRKSDNASSDAYIPSIFSYNNIKRNPCSEIVKRRFERTEIVEVTLIEDHQNDSEISDAEVERLQLGTAAIGCQTDPCLEVVPNDTNILFCWNGENDASTQTQIFTQKPRKYRQIITSNDKQLDLEMNPGFLGFPDIENDQTMQQLGGVSRNFFFVLLELLEPGKDGQPQIFQNIGRENRLLLFLMKLKLGIPFCSLSCFFRIDSTAASKIFFQVLQTLTSKTKTWISWPSKENVRTNLPSIFHNHLNCRCIIDYTEISTDTPQTVEQRVLMYSNRRSRFTVKCLIAITPDGYICKVSKTYGGRSTESFIMDDCGFFELIEPGDLVLADNDLPEIASELSKRKAALAVPPFDFNPQFIKDEIDEECNVASLRTYIERAIRRIKDSQILNHIPAELLPHVDAIMHMCCIIANSQPPSIEEHNST